MVWGLSVTPRTRRGQAEPPLQEDHCGVRVCTWELWGRGAMGGGRRGGGVAGCCLSALRFGPVRPRTKQHLPALLHSLGASQFWYLRCCLLDKDGISVLWQYFGIKTSLLPTTFPRAHHPPEMQAEKILRRPHIWVPRGLGLAMRGLPTLPPKPPCHSRCCTRTCSWWPPCTTSTFVQILLLTPPGKANGAGAYKRHADSRRHPATAFAMDDWVWLSSESTHTPWPLLIKLPLLPAACTPQDTCRLTQLFSCLHPETSPPRTLPPPSAMGPQQPGHQQSRFWTLAKQILNSTWGKLPPCLPAGLPPWGACPGTSRQEARSSPDLGFPQQVLLKTPLSEGCGARQQRRLLSGIKGTHGP